MRFVVMRKPCLPFGRLPGNGEVVRGLLRRSAEEAHDIVALGSIPQRPRRVLCESKFTHIALIVGYNEETEEVAISESWGNVAPLRWVSLSLLNWACDTKQWYIINT